MRANPKTGSCTLSSVSEELAERSMERGTSRDEADAEAQVAAMVAALFLVNRGYASIRQEDGMDGKVILSDLHPEETDFDILSERLHPQEKLVED